WVIPVFAEVFQSFGAALPAPTQFVINLSNFLIAYFWFIVVIPPAAFFGIKYYYRTESGHLNIDRISLHIPVFGDLIRKSAVARFSRTLATLVSSGVPILDALSITARTVGNRVLENAVMQARSSIAGGHTIAEPLAESKVFPSM